VVCLLFLLPLSGNAPPFGLALLCGQYAQRRVHVLALESFDVPVDDLGPVVFDPGLRRNHFSESLGVLEHGGIVFLKYRDEVFVVLEAQVDEAGLVVDGVADQHLEQPWVVGKNASNEPFGGIDFGLVRPHEFSI